MCKSPLSVLVRGRSSKQAGYGLKTGTIGVQTYHFPKLRKGPKFPGEVFQTHLVVYCMPPALLW